LQHNILVIKVPFLNFLFYKLLRKISLSLDLQELLSACRHWELERLMCRIIRKWDCFFPQSLCLYNKSWKILQNIKFDWESGYRLVSLSHCRYRYWGLFIINTISNVGCLQIKCGRSLILLTVKSSCLNFFHFFMHPRVLVRRIVIVLNSTMRVKPDLFTYFAQQIPPHALLFFQCW